MNSAGSIMFLSETVGGSETLTLRYSSSVTSLSLPLFTTSLLTPVSVPSVFFPASGDPAAAVTRSLSPTPGIPLRLVIRLSSSTVTGPLTRYFPFASLTVRLSSSTEVYILTLRITSLRITLAFCLTASGGSSFLRLSRNAFILRLPTAAAWDLP